ncbi:phosphodiesterase [Actinomadura sp. DC4]|uniref:phosphodiesterase n=1 Tax=Actinomadura sp. DC4 TaxID=3055069 RepID=UPI0025B1EC4A|nr:phosphodiesterase [Actinomadura sp. DC4]MDN3357217.1 phosphodiesterase [Actinomadura sp. DC4]
MTILAQLSDLHLSDEDPVPTKSLREAVSTLLDLTESPDAVVLTGDLADHGRPSEYALLRTEIARLPMPVHPLPGNHDDVDALLAAFPEVKAANYVVDVAGLRLLCCDSTIPGQSGGDLSDPDWLDAALAEAPGTPAVVAMHHPPYHIGVEWIDLMGQAHPERLAAVIARHPQVVRVIAGHVHAGSVRGFAGTVATTCPSAYRQLHIDPGGRPAMTDAAPGFALHIVDGDDAVTHFRQVGTRPA